VFKFQALPHWGVLWLGGAQYCLRKLIGKKEAFWGDFFAQIFLPSLRANILPDYQHFTTNGYFFREEFTKCWNRNINHDLGHPLYWLFWIRVVLHCIGRRLNILSIFHGPQSGIYIFGEQYIWEED